MAELVEKVVDSYIQLGTNAHRYISALTLEDAAAHARHLLLDAPMVPMLLTFHCLNAALRAHAIVPRGTFWLKSLVVTTFASFGGSTLAAILCGRPTPLFTVNSNPMMAYIFCAWYVVHRSSVLRAILNTRVPSAILAFGASAARMRAIFSFMDGYVREFPRAALGAIICSGLTGSGGSLFVSVEKLVQHGAHNSVSEFSAPGWGFRSAYFAAALYYAFVDPDDVLYGLGLSTLDLDRQSARLLISAAFSTHAFFEALFGTHFNILHGVESLIFAVTRLPMKAETHHGLIVDAHTQEHYAQSSDVSDESDEQRPPTVMDEGLRRRRRR